jgi:hypothetical protein
MACPAPGLPLAVLPAQTFGQARLSAAPGREAHPSLYSAALRAQPQRQRQAKAPKVSLRPSHRCDAQGSRCPTLAPRPQGGAGTTARNSPVVAEVAGTVSELRCSPQRLLPDLLRLTLLSLGSEGVSTRPAWPIQPRRQWDGARWCREAGLHGQLRRPSRKECVAKLGGRPPSYGCPDKVAATWRVWWSALHAPRLWCIRSCGSLPSRIQLVKAHLLPSNGY